MKNHRICIAGGPSTTFLDGFTDRAFVLTWMLCYVLVVRYKSVRARHFSLELARSVWTGDGDFGETEINCVLAARCVHKLPPARRCSALPGGRLGASPVSLVPYRHAAVPPSSPPLPASLWAG